MPEPEFREKETIVISFNEYMSLMRRIDKETEREKILSAKLEEATRIYNENVKKITENDKRIENLQNIVAQLKIETENDTNVK